VLELTEANKELTAYWLSPIIECKKILLAASARNLTYEFLTNQQKIDIQNSISGFSLCGVRDDATYRLLSHFISSKEKLQLIPDPTFTLEIDHQSVDEYLRRRKYNFKKPTICFHLSKNEHWGKQLSVLLKNSGFQIASFRPNDYSDIILNDLSPLEQLGIYKYFQLMITNRFHDTIFCLKNNTPMITFPFNDEYITNYGESKYYSLLKEFDLLNSNYIKKKSRISSELLFGMVNNAIEDFNQKKLSIQLKIEENKNIYYNFLNKTKAVF
jgi:exopolysaccharide biosynthesis predicted pyruvyltransferase EpsI